MRENVNGQSGDGSKPAKSTGFSVAGAVSIFILSIILAISGPFGTFVHGDFGLRLVYWSVLVLVSWFLSEGLMAISARLFADRLLVREAVTISVFTACFTPFLLVWTTLVMPGHAEGLLRWAELMVYVFAICVVISVIRHGIPYWIRAMYHPEVVPSPPAPGPVRLLRRLPAEFQGDILRISADGHRVEVVTCSDRFDLRMRLSDAVDEAHPLPGKCVHRSHWVAENAVHSVIEVRNRPVLVLTNGDEIPVGAKYQPALEDAGWLSGRIMGSVQA